MTEHADNSDNDEEQPTRNTSSYTASIVNTGERTESKKQTAMTDYTQVITKDSVTAPSSSSSSSYYNTRTNNQSSSRPARMHHTDMGQSYDLASSSSTGIHHQPTHNSGIYEDGEFSSQTAANTIDQYAVEYNSTTQLNGHRHTSSSTEFRDVDGDSNNEHTMFIDDNDDTVYDPEQFDKIFKTNFRKYNDQSDNSDNLPPPSLPSTYAPSHSGGGARVSDVVEVDDAVSEAETEDSDGEVEYVMSIGAPTPADGGDQSQGKRRRMSAEGDDDDGEAEFDDEADSTYSENNGKKTKKTSTKKKQASSSASKGAHETKDDKDTKAPRSSKPTSTSSKKPASSSSTTGEKPKQPRKSTKKDKDKTAESALPNGQQSMTDFMSVKSDEIALEEREVKRGGGDSESDPGEELESSEMYGAKLAVDPPSHVPVVPSSAVPQPHTMRASSDHKNLTPHPSTAPTAAAEQEEGDRNDQQSIDSLEIVPDLPHNTGGEKVNKKDDKRGSSSKGQQSDKGTKSKGGMCNNSLRMLLSTPGDKPSDPPATATTSPPPPSPPSRSRSNSAADEENHGRKQDSPPASSSSNNNPKTTAPEVETHTRVLERSSSVPAANGQALPNAIMPHDNGSSSQSNGMSNSQQKKNPLVISLDSDDDDDDGEASD